MMKRFYCSAVLGMLLLMLGYASPLEDSVYQISTIDALLAGVYDGHLSCEELLEHGDFGIGTFDRLEGEMVVLDGEVFQVKADGKVYRPESDETTPFASVCQFTPDRTLALEAETDFDDLKALLDQQFPNQNLFYAIKLTGTFSAMKTRSVPGQQKPYPPLGEVTANQPEFEMTNVSGTIVGFRCPPYVEGINVPGYHLHFLSDDRTQGGHILSFKLKEGSCAVDQLNLYTLELPENAESFASTDLSEDRSKELQQVEQEQGEHAAEQMEELVPFNRETPKASPNDEGTGGLEARLKNMTIDSYNCSQASLEEAVEELIEICSEQYDEKVQVVLLGDEAKTTSNITIQIRKMPLYSSLKVFAEMTSMRMEVLPDQVIMYPSPEEE